MLGGTWKRGRLRLHGQARPGLLRARVALLGTLCRDSSPRISPIEPYIVEGQLLIGAMAWSKKAMTCGETCGTCCTAL
jgi:hypothetical protein